MSIYEVLKDAVSVAQKADNIELVQKLLEVQKMALDMQEKQHEQNEVISSLKKEVEHLKSAKRFVHVPGRTYLIDPENPARPLCPVCTLKNQFAVPVKNGGYCYQCKGWYS